MAVPYLGPGLQPIIQVFIHLSIWHFSVYLPLRSVDHFSQMHSAERQKGVQLTPPT